MTQGVAYFTDANPVIYDILHTYYQWQNAVYNPATGYAVKASIRNPSRNDQISWTSSLPNGTKTLSWDSTNNPDPGTYWAYLLMWDGTKNVTPLPSGGYCHACKINVGSLAGVNGLCDFASQDYQVGDTLVADFSWWNAYLGYNDNYAECFIYPPSGYSKARYEEFDLSNGSHQLSCVCDAPGRWCARIWIECEAGYQISAVLLEDYVYVPEPLEVQHPTDINEITNANFALMGSF